MDKSKASRFFGARPTCVCVGWLGVVVLITATLSLNPAYGSENLATTSAQGDGCEKLQEQLTASQEALAERSSGLQERLQAVTASLQGLEDAGESTPAAKLTEQKDTLTTERAALQNELKFLELAHTAWQAALDECEHAARLRRELEQLHAGGQPKAEDCVASEVTALQAQLEQIQSASVALKEPEDVRGSRLAKLAELIETADEQARQVYELERAALAAQAESAQQKRAVHDAERDLLEAKLAACREVVGEASAAPGAPATKAAEADEADALNKERLAEQLDAEARNRLDFAQSRLGEIEDLLVQASAEGHDTAPVEDDREYWRRVETYEQRRLQQAELHKRSAQQKEAIGQLRQRIEEANKSLEVLGEKRSQMTRQQREERATGFKKQADAMLKEADTLHEEAEAEAKEIEPLQKLLPGIDALEKALRERLDQAGDLDDYRRQSGHFRRMKQQYDTERQQIDLVVVTRENIVYAKMQQANLTRGLADLYVQCADVLVPPVPSFWDRHRKIIHSIGILAAVIAASYAVRLLIWLIRQVLSALNALTNRRLSVKRIGTLLSFAGSILKLFVWVFGTVAILNEFGIEPSKSTGPIALIGLIMAGMFQQIVIDFVKGLDIIAGRHYNVGDFVEVDGKHGHVVDFNVKYTRIRSLSGQEFNIPNSRCVPSRRFPDGFVSNYVDITLKSSTDEDRARSAISPVCAELNQRIEAVRDEPALSERFPGRHDSVTLRYRVRVLPACDWVVRDHFIPAVKEALDKEEVELAGEPTFFFINRIETFRKLFSRRLSEEQIVREVGQGQSDPVADEEGAPQPTPGPHPG
ncbi:MAG: mechanosensitive ion channel domain-containing protein [Planctomycetota bacterium]|jgi:small conductance mechanosensitive channel